MGRDGRMDIQKGQDRVLWIDIARFLCVFIIVSVHMTLAPVPGYIHRGVVCNMLWVHALVPCFYLVSGLFVKKTPFPRAAGRVGRLVAPYVFWAVYGALIICGVGGMADFAWWQEALGINAERLLAFRGAAPVNAPLWFLWYLILFFCVAPFFKRLPLPWQAAVAVSCLICGKWVPVLNYFSYFSLGMLLGAIPMDKLTTALEKVCLPVVICAYSLPVLLMVVAGSTGEGVVFDRLNMFMGVTATLCLCVLLGKHFPRAGKCLAAWGKYAFFLFVAHWPLEVLFGRVWPQCPRWAGSLLPPVLTAMLLLTGWVAMRCFPRIAGVLLMVKPSPSRGKQAPRGGDASKNGDA